uniref:Uncharacterized protein n=1 Tax=Oryza rufipogon TaxID=4529 RepID=A0A0E0PZ23_ORYRU
MCRRRTVFSPDELLPQGFDLSGDMLQATLGAMGQRQCDQLRVSFHLFHVAFKHTFVRYSTAENRFHEVVHMSTPW